MEHVYFLDGMSSTVRSSFYLFFRQTSLDILCESSAKKTIYMKCQDTFSEKIIKKKLECCLLQGLLGALRVDTISVPIYYIETH